MISVQKVLFPGILAGCLFIVLVTNLIASPNIALASAPATASPTTMMVAAASQALPVVTLTPEQAPAQPALPAQASLPVVAVQEPPLPSPTHEAPPDPPADPPEQPECGLSAAYPDSIQQWCSLIERYAASNGLDANLIAAVMLQESGGDPRAYSRNGAVGLLQVMPRDGLAAGFMCINGPCFSSRPSTGELYDPEFNISYGTQMLAGLVQKYGNVREALRAYGPSNMGYRYADIVLGILERYR